MDIFIMPNHSFFFNIILQKKYVNKDVTGEEGLDKVWDTLGAS